MDLADQLFEFHFMQNALLTGTVVAVLAGAVGYFVVLRGQSFAAHTLAQVGFPGAAAGVLVHASPLAGLLAFCTASALGIAMAGRGFSAGRRSEAAVVGTILAFSLGLGLLFFRLYEGSAQGIYAFLFGTILGISDAAALTTAAMAAACLVVLAVIARPLLFASIDPDVAAARGVPVRALSVAFLVLVALAVAQAVQIVGTLLIFALLVAPAATALQVTGRPWLGLALSVLLSLVCTWVGLVVAFFTIYPVGFFITSLAFGAYLAIRLGRGAARRVRPA
ncbi:MAG TPA: metal ABC transporter permease [Candidatus Dormibacteraeota bacterium]|nr:metal ABC transporter permease [Candidatus Dormibacteraeota bacterium]